MAGERLQRSGSGEGLSLSVVDLFAGTLLAVFVMFLIYVWLYRDPITSCFHGFRDHLNRVWEERPEVFLQAPKFSFLRARVVLPESWLSFEPCLWDLADDQAKQLRVLLAELLPAEYQGCVESLRIEGHADTHRFSVHSCAAAYPGRAHEFQRAGPWEDNTQLSQNRARAVFETLRRLPFVEQMWSEHRVHIGGYGQSWPLVDDPASPLNRRVELHFKFYERGAEARTPALIEAAGRHEAGTPGAVVALRGGEIR